MNSPIFIIDGSSYIFRAYFALPPLTNSKGFPTGAIYGFVNMILKVLKDYSPEYVVCVFDAKAKTFRHEMFKEYKAKRPPTSDTLLVQIPYIKRITELFGIKVLEIEGVEADDVIGTLAKKAESFGKNVVIISGDKDMLQLVSDKVSVLDTMKDKIYMPKDVFERFGVTPDRIPDFMGLCGDNVDNIPGVPGIGEKWAKSLISKYGSLEEIYENIQSVQNSRIRSILERYKDNARLSKKLATIETDLDIEFDLDSFKLSESRKDELKKLFMELEFFSILKDFVEKEERDKEYICVTDEDGLSKVISELKNCEFFSIDVETTSEFPMEAEIVGISLSTSPDKAYYIPVSHRYKGCPRQLEKDFVLKSLRPYIEDSNLKKVGQNVKYDYIVLKKEGIEISNIHFDTMVASYLINPTKRNHNLDDLALQYLGYKTTTYKEVVGKRKDFSQVGLSDATYYSCEDADITLKLYLVLKDKIEEEERLKDLFYQVEIPLLKVLAKMEMAGIMIDIDYLSEISKEFSEKLLALSQKIYALAGKKFNINSSKQLSKILFEDLKLKPVKKMKTGYSTDVEVLTQLSLEHELPALVLEYRTLSKLKSTYIDTLPNLVNPRTKRIHTSYNQSTTATGRLSSSDPNLQNIPIRGEEGKRIRRAFVADKNHVFLSLDYSQIELRVLAHLSKDPILLEAFRKGEDIHTRTAQEIFGVGPDEVTADMRRKAKTINFGLIYGMSAFGLSKELGISTTEADLFMKRYYERYSGAKSYLDEVFEFAKEKGYVETILGRRRPIPEINSKNANIRQAARRVAINTPIQGSAADIIKIAMINIQKELESKNFRTKMLLQVHDELLFEVPYEELDDVRPLIKEKMESCYPLLVPLKVDVKVGENWGFYD